MTEGVTGETGGRVHDEAQGCLVCTTCNECHTCTWSATCADDDGRPSHDGPCQTCEADGDCHRCVPLHTAVHAPTESEWEHHEKCCYDWGLCDCPTLFPGGEIDRLAARDRAGGTEAGPQ